MDISEDSPILARVSTFCQRLRRKFSGSAPPKLARYPRDSCRLGPGGGICATILLPLLTFIFIDTAIGQPLPNTPLWQANAPWCAVDASGNNSKLVLNCDSEKTKKFESRAKQQFSNECFPTKGGQDAAQPCDDGDMNLFNGLMCTAGLQGACEAVTYSQDSNSGRWYRSPRRQLLGPVGTVNSFSPDMAIGIYHWLVTIPRQKTN